MRSGPHNLVLWDFDWASIIKKGTLVGLASVVGDVLVSMAAHWSSWPWVLIAFLTGPIEFAETLVHEAAHAGVFRITGYGAEVRIGVHGGTVARDLSMGSRVMWIAIVAGPLANLGVLALYVTLMVRFPQEVLGPLWVVAVVGASSILCSVFGPEGDIAQGRRFSASN